MKDVLSAIHYRYGERFTLGSRHPAPGIQQFLNETSITLNGSAIVIDQEMWVATNI
jgi:hypothetical protein